MFKNLILPFICLFLVSVIFLQIGELAKRQLVISELEFKNKALLESNRAQIELCKQANEVNLQEILKSKDPRKCVVSGSADTSFTVSCEE